MTTSPEPIGRPSMLRQIAPLRELTERNASHIHLQTVEGLSGEFRKLLLREEGNDRKSGVDVAASDFVRLYGLPADKIEFYGQSLRERTVADATETMIEEGATSPLYLAAFVKASEIERQAGMTRGALKQAAEGTHPDVSPLALPGREQDGENNHAFLLRSTFENYLRLPGIEPAIDYDELHRRHLYRFTHAREPNDFVHEVIAYRNGPRGSETIVEGKEILTLGPGRGRDEEQMLVHGGAKSIDMIEASPYMLTLLEKIRQSLPSSLQGRFRIPEEPRHVDAALEGYTATGRKFDTIYSHSSLHYVDDETLRRYLARIKQCLKPNGYFALAVKAPGAVLDGNGIPLLEEIETLQSSRGVEFTQDRIRHRMWLNFDGQTRMFRDKAVWLELLAENFAVPRVTEHSVEHYETDTQRAQTFYYFICKNSVENERRRRKQRRK